VNKKAYETERFDLLPMQAQPIDRARQSNLHNDWKPRFWYGDTASVDVSKPSQATRVITL
jgi:hypothetical protein